MSPGSAGQRAAAHPLCVADTPGAPAEKIVISRVTEEKCTVSWKIPLEDGGDTVTHYIVERRETSRLNWVIMEAECKTLSCVSSRLIKNNEYIFRVRGVNKFGPGVPLESEPVIARNAYSRSHLIQAKPSQAGPGQAEPSYQRLGLIFNTVYCCI